MLTLPTTPKGTAKLMPGRGVKINHIYYWCEAFRNFAGECQAVPVRYDPFDVGIAYAFANKQWLQCHSEYYAVLKGRSQREVMLASSEMHQRRRNHSAASSVTAGQLAEFLQSVEAEEVFADPAATRLGKQRNSARTLVSNPMPKTVFPCRDCYEEPTAKSAGIICRRDDHE